MNEALKEKINALSDQGYEIAEVEIKILTQTDKDNIQPTNLIEDIVNSPCKPCMINGSPGICCTWTF